MSAQGAMVAVVPEFDPPNKKRKTDMVSHKGGQIISASGRVRKSGLHAEVMLLTGSEGAVNTCRFAPDGKTLASAGFDKTVYLWNVYGEELSNFCVMRGHAHSITEVHWTACGTKMFSSSVDKRLIYWDAESGEKIKAIKDHTDVVNGCCPVRSGPELLCSASEDCTSKVFDMRRRGAIHNLAHQYQLTSVCFSADASHVITGGIDNIIRVWDLRKTDDPVFDLSGHGDTISGLAVSPDGTKLLSNSMDQTLRVWDIRPFCEGNRCRNLFQGARHNLERQLLRCSWSPDGKRVSCGSADQMVYVWDAETGRLMYRLPGHKGIVMEAVFAPKEPILASASRDKSIFLGELPDL